MKEIPDKSVDCIICDLPYGCLAGGDRRGEETKKNDPRKAETTLGGCAWDIKINLEQFWTQAKRILKNEHCPVIHFCTTKFGYELIKSNEKWFRYDLVWDKQRGVSFLSANKMPMRSHEMIYVFSKAGAKYNRVDISGGTPYKGHSKNYSTETSHIKASSGFNKNTGQTDGKRCALSVIQNSSSTTKGGHPTEKPESLYRWILERYSSPGDTVLDPTFGSGNSVFTAHAMGRHAIGIEMDTAFFESAVKKMTAVDIEITPVNEIIQPTDQSVPCNDNPQ